MRIKLFSNYLPLLCLTACVWVSCSQNREKKSGKKDHTPVMRLTTTTIEVPQSYVADVQAVQFVEVKPKVEGFVEAVLVDEGEHVKKGQVLFKLSSAELYEEVKEAQANHKQAQAELKMAEVEVDRIKRLVEKDIISPIRNRQRDVLQRFDGSSGRLKRLRQVLNLDHSFPPTDRNNAVSIPPSALFP